MAVAPSQAKADAAHALQKTALSDLQVHAALHEAMPGDWDGTRQSTPVRYAQLFHRPDRPTSWSNCGVAGIDGCTSTAVVRLCGAPHHLDHGRPRLPLRRQRFPRAVAPNCGWPSSTWRRRDLSVARQPTGGLSSPTEMRHGLELRSVCDLRPEHQRAPAWMPCRRPRRLWSPSDVPRSSRLPHHPRRVQAVGHMETVSAVCRR